MDLSSLLRNVSHTISRNSPTILTGLGVAGLVATVVMAVKATPKAMSLIEREQDFRLDEYGETEPLGVYDSIQVAWRPYIPTALMGLTTVGFIIMSNHISMRRNAALASLFSIAQTTLQEYQAKVVEELGEKKEELIRGKVAKEHMEKDPPNDRNVIMTGLGDYLCFDVYSGRYFMGDIEEIRRQVNVFNQHLLVEGWLGINEFYDLLGLPPIVEGDHYGWIGERNILDLKTTTTKAHQSERPCLVIDYMVRPTQI